MFEQTQAESQNQNLGEVAQKIKNEISEIKNEIEEKTEETNKDQVADLEVSLKFEKIEQIKKMLTDIQNNITRVICLLGGGDQISSPQEENLSEPLSEASSEFQDFSSENNDLQTNAAADQYGERIIEGVFNGQNMVGSDGKEYIIPPNYASKSKLVEGDLLKLTINPKGRFVYKQVGPIGRSRLLGKLTQNENSPDSFIVAHQERKWRVLTASVTYYKGGVGDEAVILVPKNAPSKWAAVENIIKKGGE